MKYKLVESSKFIEFRYKNFVHKKGFFNGHLLNEFVYMTDLDETDPETKRPLKFTIICDRCNEHIHDPHFYMLDDSFVYHANCIASELNTPANIIPFKLRPTRR